MTLDIPYKRVSQLLEHFLLFLYEHLTIQATDGFYFARPLTFPGLQTEDLKVNNKLQLQRACKLLLTLPLFTSCSKNLSNNSCCSGVFSADV